MSARRLARPLTLVALIGATVVAPLSTYRASAQSSQAKLTNLVVGWDVSDAKTMDPDRAYEFSGEIVDHSVYESLVTYKGANYTPVPDLATSWKVTGGGSIFTLFNAAITSATSLAVSTVTW